MSSSQRGSFITNRERERRGEGGARVEIEGGGNQSQNTQPRRYPKPPSFNHLGGGGNSSPPATLRGNKDADKEEEYWLGSGVSPLTTTNYIASNQSKANGYTSSFSPIPTHSSPASTGVESCRLVAQQLNSKPIQRRESSVSFGMPAETLPKQVSDIGRKNQGKEGSNQDRKENLVNDSHAKTSASKFTSKLSKSFYDLTSSERLTRWKAKLPTSARKKSKMDSGEYSLPGPAGTAPAPEFQAKIPLQKYKENCYQQKQSQNQETEESMYDLALGSYNAVPLYKKNIDVDSMSPDAMSQRSWHGKHSRRRSGPHTLMEYDRHHEAYIQGRGGKQESWDEKLPHHVNPERKYIEGFNSDHQTEGAHRFSPLKSSGKRNEGGLNRRHSEVSGREGLTAGSLTSLVLNKHSPAEFDGVEEPAWAFDRSPGSQSQTAESLFREQPFTGGLNRRYRHSLGVLCNQLYEDPPQQHIFMEHRTKKLPTISQHSVKTVADPQNNYEFLHGVFPTPANYIKSHPHRPPPSYPAPPPPAPAGQRNGYYIKENRRTTISGAIINGDTDETTGLPPPAKILPFSGVPQNEDPQIIRPIAFKPITTPSPPKSNQNTVKLRSEKSPLFTRKSDNYYNQPNHIVSSPEVQRRRQQPHDYESDTSSSIYGIAGPTPYGPTKSHKGITISPFKYTSDSETFYRMKEIVSNENSNAYHPKYLSDNESIWQLKRQDSTATENQYVNARAKPAKSGPSPTATYDSPASTRRPLVPNNPLQGPETYQKQNGTGIPNHPSSTVNNGSSSSDYDLVPEFIDYSSYNSTGNPLMKPKKFPVSSAGNERMKDHVIVSNSTSSVLSNMSMQKKNEIIGRKPSPIPTNGSSLSGSGSPQKEASGYGTTGSHGSRNSSGIHVTPSPSDSGVAELEAALKEKENELLSLRSTMEQNEEVIIKVYQEKEQKWESKLREWEDRLDHSLNTEQRLLAQIQRLEDHRSDMQCSVKNLTAEKHGLQRKCKELESELFSLRDQFESTSKHWAICRRCGDIFMPQTSGHNHKHSHSEITSPASSHTSTTRSTEKNSDLFLSHLKPPPPSPRGERDKKSPTPTEDLKSEISLLREEVNGLRDSLQQQVSAFSQERSKWENEKSKVLEYQKSLQENYLKMFNRNQELEQRISRNSSQISLNSTEKDDRKSDK